VSGHRVGIFGGAFDPIHVGHLHLAQAAADIESLDRVLFVPMATPAHRDTHAPAAHRRAMTALAIAGNERFALDDTGLEQPGPAYTADTLALLRAKRPDDAFVFIAGIDSLARSRWRRLDEVAGMLDRFLVAHRDGIEESELAPILAGLPEHLRERFVPIDVALMDVSSTAIRTLAANGRSIRYLTPDAVVEYIESNGLYREAAVS
jgi:nicotinate-nucleotide adenylyltransferase